jgi:hypothetical protein
MFESVVEAEKLGLRTRELFGFYSEMYFWKVEMLL